MDSNIEVLHNKMAPYWAVAMFLCGGIGLATVWIDLGAFWSGYVLDICGPAWNYILFRGLFTSYRKNSWTRFFTPTRTLLIFVFVCAGIEGLQYFNLYDSTYDPWDLLSYISLLVLLYLVDSYQIKHASRN